jgi:hypothetical protein
MTSVGPGQKDIVRTVALASEAIIFPNFVRVGGVKACAKALHILRLRENVKLFLVDDQIPTFLPTGPSMDIFDARPKRSFHMT